MYVLLLSVVSLSLASLTHVSAQCSSRDYGTLCSIPGSTPDTPEPAVEIIDNQLFVGSDSRLQVFSLPALQQIHSVELASDAETMTLCTGFAIGGLGQDEDDCRNFIRTIQPYTDGNIMICGTNAHHPQCNIHQASNPSNYVRLSPPGSLDTGFSPTSRHIPIQSTLAGNEKFYAATRFDTSGQPSIQMAPAVLANDTDFTVRTLRDDIWLHTPKFVSVHEDEDYIYFFLTETALEVAAIENAIYSRVIRICKTDVGVGEANLRDNLFLTFQKARILCSVGEGMEAIPFIYNNLVSTFLGQTEGGAPVLYGVFNSPSNGPAGGAICKFNFGAASDMANIFNDVNYLVKTPVNVGMTSHDVWLKTPALAFDCPGSGGTPRAAGDVERYQLKFRAIEQEEHLFVSPMAFLDKITAETVQYMGVSQEIIYFSNERGDIMQVVLAGGQQYQHTIFQPGSDSKIGTLILHRDSSTTRSLIAASEGQIIQIPRGQCSSYADCFSCFDSRDVYCAWNQTSLSCVNKLENSAPAGLIQVFSASETRITAACGNRPPPTPPTDDPDPQCPPNPPPIVPNTVETTTSTDEKQTEENEDCTTSPTGATSSTSSTSQTIVVVPVTNGLTGAQDSSIGIPVVVGASLGAFLFGLALGSVVCVLFSKQCARRLRSSHKDFSPEEPRDSTAHQNGTEVVTMMQVNNNHQVIEKENLEKPKLQPAPPRYIQHKPMKPAPDPPTTAVTTATPTQKTKPRLGSTSSLPPSYNHANGIVHPHQLHELEETDDNAFVDNDTVPPLKSFPSPGTMYGSLGRIKTGTNGVSRKHVPGHKIPRGRSDSTTWLRQRSESLSSDISSSTSPLESPISDV